jgi:hypothetical protein
MSYIESLNIHLTSTSRVFLEFPMLFRRRVPFVVDALCRHHKMAGTCLTSTALSVLLY